MMCVGVVNGNKPLSLYIHSHGHSNIQCLSNDTRTICRTLWGEHKQAALNCYIDKVFLVKYQNTVHRHVEKRGLLSLYPLQNCLP